MFYLKDENVTNYLADDCFYVNDIDFIMATFNALAFKKYYNANLNIIYNDDNTKQFSTVILNNGRTNLMEIMSDNVLTHFTEIKEFFIELNFKYKHKGEAIRERNASHIKLWYNSKSGRLYMTEKSKRILYIQDCLLSFSYELRELLDDIDFILVNIPKKLQYSYNLYVNILKQFEVNKIFLIHYKGNYNTEDKKFFSLLPYLDPNNYSNYIALGDDTFGECYTLTGADILHNIKNNNLNLNNIYCISTDAIIKLDWSCNNITVLPLAVDSVSYIKKLLGQ